MRRNTWRKISYGAMAVVVVFAWGVFNKDFVTSTAENVMGGRQETILAYAPAPAPAYSPQKSEPPVDFAPAPVAEPVRARHEQPKKSPLDNPLINSLAIPLGLYLGKKTIDLIFAKLKKEIIGEAEPDEA
jgi:hypothetical protein